MVRDNHLERSSDLEVDEHSMEYSRRRYYRERFFGGLRESAGRMRRRAGSARELHDSGREQYQRARRRRDGGAAVATNRPRMGSTYLGLADGLSER